MNEDPGVTFSNDIAFANHIAMNMLIASLQPHVRRRFHKRLEERRDYFKKNQEFFAPFPQITSEGVLEALDTLLGSFDVFPSLYSLGPFGDLCKPFPWAGVVRIPPDYPEYIKKKK